MNEPREAGDGEESPENPSLVGPRKWQPNDDYLKVLVSMGVSKNAAEKALFYTGNRSPDLAAAWIFENPDADLESPLNAEADDVSDDDVEITEMYKMVFVVNGSLEMGIGKLAAQVAHATLGMHRLLLQDESKYGDMLLQWEECGETKIVLKGNNTQHLVELENNALSLALPTYLVQDAGKTQIPAGSTTVLCIMGRIDIVDQVTGSLRLLQQDEDFPLNRNVLLLRTKEQLINLLEPNSGDNPRKCQVNISGEYKITLENRKSGQLLRLIVLVFVCVVLKKTEAQHPQSLRDIYNYNYVDEDSSTCAVVLQRTYSKSSPAPSYGGFYDSFKKRRRRQDYVYSSNHDVCVTYDDVNSAIRQAKRNLGYRHPRAVDNTLEPMPADISTVATLNLEVTRILAQRYKLSADEITNALPLIDPSRTEFWHVCPAFVKPIPCTVERFRTYTGHCNNLKHSNWGAQNTFFTRFLPPAYANGIDSPRASVVDGSPLPLARFISTYVHPDLDFSSHDLSILFMSWSQFIDHDLTLAAPTRDKFGNDFNCCGIPRELQDPNCLTLDIPRDDPFLSKTGQTCMEFKRVLAGLRPNCAFGPRGHINMLTSQMDASFIYGSNEQRARLLRSFQGGQLRVWDRFRDVGLKPLLPPASDNPDLDCIARPRELFCFLAGDDRANLQIHLPVLHTLYMREHNRIAEGLAKINPHWDDERIYQETRHISAAASQHITYNEFLPLLLGEEVTHQYNLTLQKHGYWNGYNPKMHIGLSTQFQVASFRFGHTFIHDLIFLYNKYHEFIKAHRLRFLVRQPWILYDPGNIDLLIGGLVNSPSQEHDVFLSHEMSNHLFQEPRQMFGLDLPATNIERGREMGIPGYNAFRDWCGLPKARSFSDLAPWLSNGTAYKYSQIYKHVDDIDLWTAGISEYRLKGARIGPTFACLIARQFVSVRSGDRFWYENSGLPSSFTPEQLHEIRKSSQAKIICQNADDFPTIQAWAMRLPHPIYNPRVRCSELPDIDLTYWQEDQHHGGYFFRKK